MYGLKQASFQWNQKLDDTLKKFDLESCKMDACIYYSSDQNLIVAIYVDDFLIFYKDVKLLNALKSKLCNKFKMKDMGLAKTCIGIRINQLEDRIELDQSIYINEILKRFNMIECKPIRNPADTSIKLYSNMICDKNNFDMNQIPYQQAVGSLLFVAQATRPDISYAVNTVSRFNNNFKMPHWKAIKRIFRYLKQCINFKLVYSKTNLDKIIGYSDADWGSNIDNRKSCSGYVFNYANGPKYCRII